MRQKWAMNASIVLMMSQLMGGCSSTTWDAVYDTWELSGSGKKDAKLTDDYIKSLPYASLLVAIEPKVEALMVLESINANQLQWRANNGSVIVTEGGRVVSAQIEAINYRIIAAHNGIDPVRKEDWSYTHPYRLIMDMPHLGVYQQLFECRLSQSKPKTQAFKTPLRTTQTHTYLEQCQLSDGRFSQQNLYWVDAGSKKVVKAKQHFHPKLPGAIVFSEAKPLGWPNR